MQYQGVPIAQTWDWMFRNFIFGLPLHANNSLVTHCTSNTVYSSTFSILFYTPECDAPLARNSYGAQCCFSVFSFVRNMFLFDKDKFLFAKITANFMKRCPYKNLP